jgi:hypothetical protein
VRDWREWVRSEAEAGLLWIVASPRVAPGLYVCADVGAGTTDVSVFRIAETFEDTHWIKGKLAFYSAYSERPGMDAIGEVIAARVNSGLTTVRTRESDLLRIHELNDAPEVVRLLRRIFEVYQAGWRLAYKVEPRQAAWRPFGLFVLGGGCRVDAVVKALKKTPWVGALEDRRTQPNEFPNDLYELFSDRSGEYRRFDGDGGFLLVAYGLSFLRGDVPPVVVPDQVTPYEPPRHVKSIDQDDYYPK